MPGSGNFSFIVGAITRFLRANFKVYASTGTIHAAMLFFLLAFGKQCILDLLTLAGMIEAVMSVWWAHVDNDPAYVSQLSVVPALGIFSADLHTERHFMRLAGKNFLEGAPALTFAEIRGDNRTHGAGTPHVSTKITDDEGSAR